MSPKDPIIRADDAMTAEEITGDASPHTSTDDSHVMQAPRNAFTELMSGPKAKLKATAENTNKGKPPPPSHASSKRFLDPRDGLLVYIEQPETNPEGRVVEYDDDFVVIRDKFPKASVHLLLLPRDPTFYDQHPLEALSSDPDFLEKVKIRIERLKTLAANELRRQYGQHSAADAPYQSALEDLMSSPDPPPPEKRDEELPPGRDWRREIIAGVHTHPSMNHLHVHVLSREMASPWFKTKKHYLSFQTSFLVSMDQFPLEEGSTRFHPGNWPSWDLVCWRCGRNFRNKFKALQEHLGEEVREWKIE
ncbi:aprataxin-like protein [Kalmusia sp. IMI 367209]|nr:aprataxin-like protein [Kalmusia sp. IMI 367209]